MDQIMEVAIGLRRKFVRSIINYTDPAYFILRNKKAPLSKEETDFVELY